MKPKPHWLTRPESIRKVWIAFIIVLAATVVADFAIHRHTFFVIDGTFGYYAWFGFIACVVLIFLAKLLGFIIKRQDDYYENH